MSFELKLLSRVWKSICNIGVNLRVMAPYTSIPRQGRRRLLLSLLFGLALQACGQNSSTPASGDEEQLVVLVIVDTLRRDALGCYGNDQAQTPNIDALAAEGTRFSQAISASGWTLPSIASMLTGNWPAMHKALGKSTRLTPITNDLPLAAEVFSERGFTTLGFANAAFLSPLLGFDRGFDVFDHVLALSSRIRRADATVDAALSALSQHPAEKVFLMVHLFDAHLSYDPPEGFITPFVGSRRMPDMPISMKECRALCQGEGLPPKPEDIKYLRGAYQGEVAFIDTAIGRLIGGFKDLGRWEHTTLALTADHGEEFWEHGGFEHGHTLYGELVHIPLILRTPTSAKSSTHEVPRQVRTIDILPTLFDLAGIEDTPSFIGQSLQPDLLGHVKERIPPAFSQGTLYGSDKMSWRHHGYNLIVDQARQGAEAMELYDLRSDPLETRDISAGRPNITRQLSAELARFSRDLMARASTISTPPLRDMSPQAMQKYIKSIEALGYTGREDK